MNVDFATVVRRTEEQVSCNLNDEVVVLNLQNSLYYGIDDVGACAWEAISEPKPVGEICKKVAEEFGVTVEQCRDDIIGFLEKLEKAGLVKFESEGAQTRTKRANRPAIRPGSGQHALKRLPQHLDDPLRRLAVPFFGDGRFGRRLSENILGGRKDRLFGIADEPVRSLDAGDRPLGIVPQRDAGDAKNGRLLLQSAAVGEHHARMHVEMQKVDIAERLAHPDAAHGLALLNIGRKPNCLSHLPRARMNGKDDRQIASRSPASAERMPAKIFGSSTFEGRCSVSVAYAPFFSPSMEVRSRPSA